MKLKEKYYTITQAAKAVGVTRQTISRWLAEGKLTAEVVGREKLIDIKQIHSLRLDPRLNPITSITADEIMRRYYSKGDKIECIGDAYLVTKTDGTMEKVEAEEFIYTFDAKRRTTSVELKGIVRKPYKEGVKRIKR